MEGVLVRLGIVEEMRLKSPKHIILAKKDRISATIPLTIKMRNLEFGAGQNDPFGFYLHSFI